MSAAINAFALAATMLAHAAAVPATAQSGPGTTSPAPTACSLITAQEIAGIIGTRVRDGEPEDVKDGYGTACRFRFISSGDWVNIAVGPTDIKTFATVRKLFGPQAEMQAGVGDEAYHAGNLRIYVRVGTQMLIIGFARNDQGTATTKAQLLALAKLGTPRLR